jgi:hypothetical protein
MDWQPLVPSPEREFMNAILSRVFGQRLKSSETQVLVGFSTFVFPFYKMLFMNKLKSTRVFPFRGFFLLGFLKPE